MEINEYGRKVWSAKVPSPWSVERLKNGNTLVNTMRTEVLELDPKGEIVWKFTRADAEAQGYHDALMLDYRGYVAESTGANIFFLFGKDKVIHTPKPDCFLDGITRRTVIGLARRRGWDVIERVIMPDEVGKATEVFLTGTAAEVTPVGSIDQHTFTPGEVSRTLMEDYEREAGKTSPTKAA